MIVCLDGGNTRLKWGLADDSGWVAQGSIGWYDSEGLAKVVESWAAVEQILFASVAGEAKNTFLIDALPGFQIQRVSSVAAAGGVHNHYQVPDSLGVDRWCALIGARSLTTAPCLVVTAGTATTVDSLDSTGNFLGGFILPGVSMMQAALAEGTAQLPLDYGAYEVFPRCTRDAIYSGCLEAQVGAIERAFHRLPGAGVCFLSGGAAGFLQPRLQVPVQGVENLVLEGIRHLYKSRNI